MPKKAFLAPHLTSAELKQKYLKAHEPVESRRLHLLWKISLGWSIKNSALAVGLNYEYARRIVQAYNNRGIEEVKNKRKQKRLHQTGKKPLLTQQQLEKLAVELQKKPSDGGIWTGPKVARWIEQETGKEKVWNQRGWDYLKKSNYSWQKPRPRHYKASC